MNNSEYCSWHGLLFKRYRLEREAEITESQQVDDGGSRVCFDGFEYEGEHGHAQPVKVKSYYEAYYLGLDWLTGGFYNEMLKNGVDSVIMYFVPVSHQLKAG